MFVSGELDEIVTWHAHGRDRSGLCASRSNCQCEDRSTESITHKLESVLALQLHAFEAVITPEH